MWYTYLNPVWKNDIAPTKHEQKRVHLYDGANVVGIDKKRPIDLINQNFQDEKMPHRVLKGTLMIRAMPKTVPVS